MFNNSTVHNWSECKTDLDLETPSSMVTNYLDISIRFLSVFVHIVYALIVFNVKKLRNCSYLLMHHVNLVSFFYVLHFMAFINHRTLLFGNMVILEKVMCTISELIWSIFRYLRTYSILLLAIYRYISVHNIQLLRKIKSKKNLLLIIFSTWLLCTILTLILKFSLRTTYSVFFCSPGFSNSIILILINFIIANFIANVLPTILVLFFYVSISRKINQTRSNLKKRMTNNKVSDPNLSSHGSKDLCKTKDTELKFARQFFLINLISILASILSIFVNFLMVLAAHENFCFLDILFKEFRPIIRALFLMCQSFIPILSIFYNPEYNIQTKVKKILKLKF